MPLQTSNYWIHFFFIFFLYIDLLTGLLTLYITVLLILHICRYKLLIIEFTFSSSSFFTLTSWPASWQAHLPIEFNFFSFTHHYISLFLNFQIFDLLNFFSFKIHLRLLILWHFSWASYWINIFTFSSLNHYKT